ncbi:beta-lactamase/transpeptidase-like protein [Geopyxis carbonaria]|nr:beta-lactamase/transpeptidase-like protein [Geopyxis carbonaria]
MTNLLSLLLLGTLVQQGFSHGPAAHSSVTVPDHHAHPAPTASPACHFPGPVFPIPEMKANNAAIKAMGKNLTATLQGAIADNIWAANVTSLSVQLTSKTENLWSFHYTPEIMGNYTDGKPRKVDSDTVFRIGSVTKVFTVLAALVQKKGVCLDDPITKWIPELGQGENKGGIMWEEITLRQLGSQMSGLPRSFAYGDLVTADDPMSMPRFDPIALGFPPLNASEIPPCGKLDNDVACTQDQLLAGVKDYSPVFAPADRPTYSNLAYDILGIAIERMTGKSFSEVLQTDIFSPLGMTNSGLKKPADSAGAIPALPNQWALDFNNENPAGGMYSTVNDLSAFIRSLWSHKILTAGQSNAWLKPTSFNSGPDSTYGMPWEIRRLAGATRDGRTIDMYTKSGGVGGYYSLLIIIPEYGLGGTILTTADPSAVGAIESLIGDAVIGTMERLVRTEAASYTGTFASTDPAVNSSLTLASYPGPGLRVTEWITNSTDLYSVIGQEFGGGAPGELFIRASPVGVKKAGGEAWRMTLEFVPAKQEPSVGLPPVCITDIDALRYGRESATEMVMRGKDKMWLPAFRIELEKEGRKGY